MHHDKKGQTIDLYKGYVIYVDVRVNCLGTV